MNRTYLLQAFGDIEELSAETPIDRAKFWLNFLETNRNHFQPGESYYIEAAPIGWTWADGPFEEGEALYCYYPGDQSIELAIAEATFEVARLEVIALRESETDRFTARYEANMNRYQAVHRRAAFADLAAAEA